MDRLRLARTAARVATPPATLATLLLLAACQTTVAPPTPPPVPRGLEEASGTPYNTPTRGWSVTIHKPASGKTYCQAVRTAPVPAAPTGERGGPGMVFRTAAVESGFTLTGTGAAVTAGERYDLTASFDQGSKVMLGARGLPGGGLYVAIPSKTYLEELEPFARNRRVTFRSAALGELGTLLLNGSSWAINASDECRILHADS
ncbi:hypothetical protein [Azospirillum agricola]|uniref:hypothetical protein n=1 Tax=Azospirillum agricola TaxID=1720247 RepID=UPI000A0F2021|nr:hypothetical protein [Azospirillum agricola]SMH52183.1 hypothetical protein SAMN02982994_3044 [Azospirillum lipoferum]